MNLKRIPVSVCLTTGLLLVFPISAHAVTANLSSGSATNLTTSAIDGGTFSTIPGSTTINFNSQANPTAVTTGNGSSKVNSYKFNSGIATYEWTTTGSTTPTTAIKKDSFAPPGPLGVTNGSNYLAVFGEPVTITFSQPLGYFGLDWGFADTTNTVEFYKNTTDTTASAKFTCTSLFSSSTCSSGGGGNEQSSYVDFTAKDANDTFSKIVLSNGTGTGFETDNHAYRIRVPFGFSPGLGILGLGALGSIAGIKSKVQKWKLSSRSAVN